MLVAHDTRERLSRPHQMPRPPGNTFDQVARAAKVDRAGLARLAKAQRGAAVAHLQRTVGNAAVQVMLQRQPVQLPVVLTSAQVNDAIRYHKYQPQKYPVQVVEDIQQAVQATVTGKIDAETVQKIAQFQQTINDTRRPVPLLAVDGKAGPRTLPILIPVGLATADQIMDYTQDIRMIEPMLGKLPPEERAALLLVEVNDRLQSAGVPIIENLEFDSTLNQFDSKTWTMTVGLNTLADPMKAAATMYHEARHADQAFRIARMLAGRKPQPSNQEIGRRAGIDDPDIVQAAVDQKIDPETTEATQAEGWHEDEPGRPSRQQQNARQATTAERFRQAAKRFKQNPTEHNHAVAAAAYEDFKAAQIDAYRNQPNEYDAFFVEEKVGDLLGVERSDFPPLDEAIDQVTAE